MARSSKHSRSGVLLGLLLTLSIPALAGDYGPDTGSLLIVGGGNQNFTGISEKFIELAGGRGSKLVVIPTAKGNFNKDGSVREHNPQDYTSYWTYYGFEVEVLHTHDKGVADTDAFVAPLREADAVWFFGGRQWNLVDSYTGTLTEKELHALLDRGGVIGGSSAGATIQGDYLVRGDSKTNRIMMTDETEHQKGFAFLRKTAIDQHIDAFDRWDDLVPVIERYPDLLGIGIAESTAIVVVGDVFEVIGEGKVTVHDNSRTYGPKEKPYLVLSSGESFDMKNREVLPDDA